MKAKQQVDFYFDYISPFAYLAWQKLPELGATIDINFKPILFAALLNHWGQKGPAEIPPKREYVFTQCARYAARKNISFTLPKYHPFNPVTSLRLSLLEVAGEAQQKIMRSLWLAGWQQGRDLSDKKELANILNENDLPGAELIAATEDPTIKTLLKANTDNAIAQGVFGVPSIITEDGTLFWGLDALDDLEYYCQHGDPVDKQQLKKILARESAAQRVK